jgi:hypothetical protein
MGPVAFSPSPPGRARHGAGSLTCAGQAGADTAAGGALAGGAGLASPCAAYRA